MSERFETAKVWLAVFFKGMAMGAADVVPGVSGGTIAFITGIYSRLISAISRVDTQLFAYLLGLQWRQAWSYIDATFLACLASGIFVSILSLAHVVSYLLAYHPVLIWSFFVGLVIASSILLLSSVERWTAIQIIALAFGILLAVFVNQLKPATVEISYGYIFVCGMIAICAMLLPGISGSFLLLMLGAYTHVLDAIKSFDLTVIAVFGAGALCGMLSFAKVLNWALTQYKNTVLGFLTGVLLGSLLMIWPWKIDSGKVLADEAILINSWPWVYEQQTGNSSHMIYAIVLMLVAAGIVLSLGRIRSE